MEIFNEFTIIIIMYHLFLFSDFFPDVEKRYNLGFSLIIVFGLNVLTNMVVMFISAVELIKFKVKYWIKRLRSLRSKEKAKIYEVI